MVCIGEGAHLVAECGIMSILIYSGTTMEDQENLAFKAIVPLIWYQLIFLIHWIMRHDLSLLSNLFLAFQANCN